MLVVANQRLESLVSQVEGRLEIDVGEEESEGGSIVGGTGAGVGVSSGEISFPGSTSSSGSQAVPHPPSTGNDGMRSGNNSGPGSREPSWAERNVKVGLVLLWIVHSNRMMKMTIFSCFGHRKLRKVLWQPFLRCLLDAIPMNDKS